VMADVNELQRAAVGNRRIEGIEPITNLLPVEAPTISNTNSNTMVEEAPVDILLSSEPEFPGGMKAWLKYLQRNLRIPDGLMAGETKTVLIRFKVDADGAVTGFEVLQSAGTEYDEEVMRVLKKMPKWKPALQQGV